MTDQEVTPEVGPKEKAKVMEAKPKSGKEKTERKPADERLLRKALVKTIEDEITRIEEKKKKRATALLADGNIPAQKRVVSDKRAGRPPAA